MVKNPPAMQETWLQSLGWKNLLEKGMVTHSSILAWRIPWTEEAGRLHSMRSQRLEHDGATFTSLYKQHKVHFPWLVGDRLQFQLRKPQFLFFTYLRPMILSHLSVGRLKFRICTATGLLIFNFFSLLWGSDYFSFLQTAIC